MVRDLQRACALQIVVVIVVLALLIVVPISLLLIKGRTATNNNALCQALLSTGVASQTAHNNPTSLQSGALAYTTRMEVADGETWLTLVVAFGLKADSASPDHDRSESLPAMQGGRR